MRIISGKARGTKLYTLDGLQTRPTLDRVKESLFNIINERIYDAKVIDLFSGSGAIGLEFASRGAKEVVLCDNSKDAIEIIKKNVDKTHLQDNVKIYKKNFNDLLESLQDTKWDIIYLDPPYKTDFIIESLKKIIELKLLTQDGLIIAETDEFEKIQEQIKKISIDIIDKRKYGRAYLFFLTLRET